MDLVQHAFPLPPEMVDQIVSAALSDHLLALFTTVGYPFASWNATGVVAQVNSIFRSCTLRIVAILLPVGYQDSEPLVSKLSRLAAGLRHILCTILSPAARANQGPDLPCLELASGEAEAQYDLLDRMAAEGGPFFSYAVEVVKARHVTVWLRSTAWDREYWVTRRQLLAPTIAAMDRLMEKNKLKSAKHELEIESRAPMWSSQKHLHQLAKDLLAVAAEACIVSTVILNYEQCMRMDETLRDMQNMINFIGDQSLTIMGILREPLNDLCTTLQDNGLHEAETRYLQLYCRSNQADNGLFSFYELQHERVVGTLKSMATRWLLPKTTREYVLDLIIAWEVRRRRPEMAGISTDMVLREYVQSSVGMAVEDQEMRDALGRELNIFT